MARVNLTQCLPTAVHRLLAWYDAGAHSARDMPWRKTHDPYAIWLSEIMLQQTQVETVKPYFERFLQRFPTVAALAKAQLPSVLALWAGLGYYRRARHLHAAAQKIVAEHDGRLPSTVAELRRLPGIGLYTAGAVASIAFGRAAPAVDGNVMRVLARLTGYAGDPARPAGMRFIRDAAGEMVRGADAVNNTCSNICPSNNARYGDVNQALMELGATLCAPLRPACTQCPLAALCRAFAEGRQHALPVRRKRRAVPAVHGLAVVVVRSRKQEAGSKKEEALLMRRPMGGLWEGLWEFPVLEERSEKEEASSRKQEGRSRKELVRSVTERWGVEVANVEPCGYVRHQLTHRAYTYEVWRCTAADAARPSNLPPRGGGCYTDWCWVAWPLRRGVLPVSRAAEKVARAAADASPPRV